MTVALTGAGSLFVRLGHIGGWLIDINVDRLTTWDSHTDLIQVDWPAFPAADVVKNLGAQYNSGKNALTPLLKYLQTISQNTVIRMVYDDTKISPLTLEIALKELIRQMTASANYIEIPTITTSAGAALASVTNVGNGIVSSSKLNEKGVQMDYMFNETIRLVCTDDSYNTATVAREPWTVTGLVAIDDTLSELWPGGSGASTSTRTIDPGQDASTSTGNILTNSDFNTFTVANTPDSWTTTVGTAGVEVFNGGTGYRGVGCVEFLGTAGLPLTAIVQDITTLLDPLTVYAVNIWTKVLTSAPAAGVLKVSLVDGIGTTPTIINDMAGTANAITVDLTLETTAWASHTGYFRTKSSIDTVTACRVSLTTALTNTKGIYFDDLSFAKATQAYVGGPWIAPFPGSTPWVEGDTMVVTVSNNYGSAWAKMVERMFEMRSLGLQIPSTTVGAETIADSLIV